MVKDANGIHLTVSFLWTDLWLELLLPKRDREVLLCFRMQPCLERVSLQMELVEMKSYRNRVGP